MCALEPLDHAQMAALCGVEEGREVILPNQAFASDHVRIEAVISFKN